MFDEHDIKVSLDIVREKVEVHIGLDANIHSSSPANVCVDGNHLGSISTEMKCMRTTSWEGSVLTFSHYWRSQDQHFPF